MDEKEFAERPALPGNKAADPTEEAIREAYLHALAREREGEIRRQAMEKARVILRTMDEREQEEYLQSPSFQNVLNQTRKKDRVSKALAGGEWPEDYQAEYDSLRGLIEAELRGGHSVDLAFLRSVRRIRQPLRKAREARRRAEDNHALNWMRKNAGDLADLLVKPVSAFLQSRQMTSFARPEEKSRISVTEGLLRGLFNHGLPREVAERAVPGGNLTNWLCERAYEAYPALGACRELRLEGGTTVASRVREQANKALPDILRLLKARYPRQKLRKLLEGNRALREMQSDRDKTRAGKRELQNALLDAMPENVKDLWPLAREKKRRFILHLGPTNSGKTFESIQRLQTARNGIYLGPLRLLAFEQFETLNMADVPCSLVTGEERIAVPGSRVQSSTVEMADLEKEYDVAVVDECQMIADSDRGGAWSAAVLGLRAEEIHLCASPDAERLLTTIIQDCGDEMTIVRHERMAPLKVEEAGFHFPSSVRRGDALIVFSRARVHGLAAELKQKGFTVSLIYGALPPDVRRDQAERFRRGETEVVVSTDAIAMGMNLPIARIVFMESEKFDGDMTRPLTDSEVRQIAGRAGRYGQYDIGYVNAAGFRSFVANALERPALPLTHAVIRFPESLLGLPMTLTETISRWVSMKDPDCFTKASAMRMASLAAHMETRHTDKRLLYDFICIPFDESDPRLLEVWKGMYHAETMHRHYDIYDGLPGLMDPEECTVSMLDRLEENYRLCDLYYNYVRRFLEEPDRTLAVIQQRKDLISSGIIHVLSTQKLPGRVCAKCGHRLSWDWPYTICDSCWRHFYR